MLILDEPDPPLIRTNAVFVPVTATDPLRCVSPAA
jgi:hypothetical protein